MVEQENKSGRVTGVLEAGEVGVLPGQALYWDALGTLTTCGINDNYRFAGVCRPLGAAPHGDGGDTVGLDSGPGNVVQALADGASTYAPGEYVTLGALGVFIPFTSEMDNWTHLVSAAEAGAQTVQLPPHISKAFSVTNDGVGGGVAGSHIVLGPSVTPVIILAGPPTVPGLTSCSTTGLITFGAAQLGYTAGPPIVQDTINVDGLVHRPRIGQVVVGGVAPTSITIKLL
jgi:hypothetical protein